MRSDRLTRLAVLAAAPLACMLAVACQSRSATVTPSIAFTTVPRADPGGPTDLEPIAGRVTGAKPNQRIVLFAKSNRVWYVQPFRSRPFTNIEKDSTWKSTIHLGTDYAALLVDADYTPPVTTDALPPLGGSVAAVATMTGSGNFVAPPRKTLRFSGYEWDIRQTPADRHGANEYEARNAWVDDSGHLHLRLTEREGRWTSAEVRLMRSLGYGTYEYNLRDTSQLDPAAAFGMFTFDEQNSDQNHRQMGFDIRRWGDARDKNAQYALQPDYIAANVFRFATPAGRLTHSFRWEPGIASFKTVGGAGSAGGAIVAERQFTSGVPVTGAETVHLSLVYVRDSPNPPARDVEVVVEKFVYLP